MRALAPALGLALAACVIIPPDPPPPTQVPVPFPGGDPTGTSVLYLVRIDRSAANLATEYEEMVDAFSATLRASGLVVANEAVGILYDDQPELIWGRRDPVPAQHRLSDVIRFHAARAPDALPEVCTTTMLMRFGLQMSSFFVIYPPELGGGVALDGGELVDAGQAEDSGETLDGGEVTPLRPFEGKPSAFVSVLIEPSARPFGYHDFRCRVGSMQPAVYFDGFEPVEWLIFERPEKLPRILTRLVFVATAEGISGSEMRRRCAEIPGFPKPTLDVIGPSQVPFFTDFTQVMEANTDRVLVHRNFDFCQAAAGTWDVSGFAQGWVADVKRSVGLSP